MTHLCFLVVTWLSLSWVYPAAVGPMLLLTTAGMVAELAPIRWRRLLLSELLLLGAGVLTFFWSRSIDATIQAERLEMQAFAGWLRMVVAYWIFIPCRIGMLRWLPLLITGEIVFAARTGLYEPIPPEVLAEIPLLQMAELLDGWLRRLLEPLFAHPGAARFLQVAIAIGALAADAHLRVGCARRDSATVGSTRWNRPLRWLLPPIALAVVLGSFHGVLVIRAQLVPRSAPLLELDRDSLGLDGTGPMRIEQEMHIGDPRWTSSNPAPVAWMTVTAAAGTGPRYLRMQALPYPRLTGTHLAWSLPGVHARPIGSQPILHRGHTSQLEALFVRAGMIGEDVVPIPDGCNRVGLDQLLRDPHGNLYHRGFGAMPRRYNCDVGATAYPAGPHLHGQRAMLIRVPQALSDAFAAEIAQLEQWRSLDAEAAATSIVAFLRRRCSYALNDLPQQVDPRPGGALLTFLLDPQPQRRRGHCQYFASALTLLLRAADKPARCVTGFASTEHHDGRIIFRARNAHAWSEVLAQRDGRPTWVRIDATPEGDIAPLPSAEPEPTTAETPDQALPDTPDAPDPEPSGTRLPWLPLTGFALLLGLGALFVVLRRRERDPRTRALERQTDDLVHCALSLGIAVEPHTTLSRLIAQIQPHTDADLDPLLRCHLAARYDEGPLPPPWPLERIRRDHARRLRGEPRSTGG
ncbi:MAG: transglutaminase-like domain-containing protein [Planctomycetota bacterium]